MYNVYIILYNIHVPTAHSRYLIKNIYLCRACVCVDCRPCKYAWPFGDYFVKA